VADTRPRVPLNGKTVNLAQLAAEVGAALTASDTEVVVADDTASVTASALKTALDAHTPTPAVDHAAQFDQAVGAIDTSKVTDPAAKAALDAIKSVLTGGKGPGADPRRPVR
jgi:hypothetical protein